MDKLLVGTAQVIRCEFRGSDHALVDPAPQTPAVSVVDSAGTLVVNGNAAKDGAVGKYKFTFTPAQLANLGVLTATWSPNIGGNVNTYTTYHEVVGGYLFTISDARAYAQGLDDVNSISDQQIVDTRSLVEDRFERWCGVSFVPRGALWVADGDYYRTSEILLVNPMTQAPAMRLRKVRSITMDGSVVDITSAGADLVVYKDSARIWRRQGFFNYGWQNLAVVFEHGWDASPGPISQAGLDYGRALLIGNNEDERTVNMSSELDTRGVAMMDLRTRWRPTGIPKVDAVLWDYNVRYAGVA